MKVKKQITPNLMIVAHEGKQKFTHNLMIITY